MGVRYMREGVVNLTTNGQNIFHTFKEAYLQQLGENNSEVGKHHCIYVGR